MTTLYQQFFDDLEPDKIKCPSNDNTNLDWRTSSSNLNNYNQSSTSLLSHNLRAQNQQSVSSPSQIYSTESITSKPQQQNDKLLNPYERDSKLDQHEREQHLHQLQSIGNMLFDLPSPSSQSSYSSSKYSHELSSPNTVNSGSLDDMSVSNLLGLELSRGSLSNVAHKEQQGIPSSIYDANAYKYHQKKENIRNRCTNSIMEMPNSPISVHTPASPNSVGSIYSNPYSSKTSSPFTTSSSASTNHSQQSFSSSRSVCHGRPIRGACSIPYGECGSPPSEFPQPTFCCNGPRSDSPSDSENSGGSIDRPLSSIMDYLTVNSGQHGQQCCRPPYPSALIDNNAKHTCHGRITTEQELFKEFCMQAMRYTQQCNAQQYQQRPSANHYRHHHNFSQAPNQHLNQPRNRNIHCNRVHSHNVKSLPTSPLNSTPALSQQTLDQVAKIYRNSASTSRAPYTWEGKLPSKTQNPIGYSSKVFFGGIPYDATDSVLCDALRQFGQIRIEWPAAEPKGYCHIIFESEKQVKALLSNCTQKFTMGERIFQYKIISKRIKSKLVEVIPWALDDTNYVESPSQKLDPEKTIFIGAIHGMMTALGLATVMNDLFGNVAYVGIDTNTDRYPIGAARLTFSSKQSYDKAIDARFVDIKTPKFKKTLQLDPYIEDSPCSSCYVQQGPYFCREPICFRYYCHTCWYYVHNQSGFNHHLPISRGSKNLSVTLNDRL